MLKILSLGISFANYRKSKIQKKILKEARGKEHRNYRRTKIRITSYFWNHSRKMSRAKHLTLREKKQY